MSRIVIDLNDRRPVWSQPDWFADRIRSAAPGGWEVIRTDTPSEGTGDGATRAHPEVLKAVAAARVYMAFGISEDVLRAGSELGWVHSGSAGVASSLTPEMRRRDVILTNTAGVHGPPMAEAVLGMILHFSRGFDFAVAAARERRWHTAPFYAADTPVRELSRSTVGIVGLGGIGEEVAWRCRALGARVVGLRRTRNTAGPEGVEVRHGREGLLSLLGESDFAVVTAPETAETRGMVDAEALAAMPSHAVLINVARGGIVDEEALVAALASDRIRGAGLDVFQEEPLAEDSPLWSMDNVLVTPHVSPVTRHFWERQVELVTHNLRCFVDGRTSEMRNVVDKEAGY